MDVENILKLADYIEECDSEFDLSTGLSRGCGTVACIAGHAFLMKYGNLSYAERHSLELCNRLGEAGWAVLESTAVEMLDLDEGQVDDLLTPYFSSVGKITRKVADLVTAEDAASVLRSFAKTGEVNWSGVSKRIEEELIH